MNDDYLNSLLEHLIDCVNETDEIEHIELKHNNTDCLMIGETISAVSNVLAYRNLDKGYVVWGVDDKSHDILGTTFKPDKAKAKGNQNLKIWLEKQLSYSSFTFHFFKSYELQHPIVILEINKPTIVPVDFRGKRYVRIGSSNTELKNPEIESQIFQNLLVQSFEDQIAFENIVIHDLVNIIEFDHYYKLLDKSIPSDIATKIEAFQSEGFVIKDINGVIIN